MGLYVRSELARKLAAVREITRRYAAPAARPAARLHRQGPLRRGRQPDPVIVAVDSSAVPAILQEEPERDAFAAILAGNAAHIPAGSLIELPRVARMHRGEKGVGEGRRQVPAVLNFGDLFAYALARQLDAPLLFKGDDFSKTDLTPASAG